MKLDNTLSIELNDGTRIYCFDGGGILYQDVLRVFDMAAARPHETFTLQISGESWPVELEIPVASLKSVKSTVTEKINFSPKESA